MSEPHRDNRGPQNAPAHPRPDVRQSFVQTLLAGAFLSVGATLGTALHVNGMSNVWLALASALAALVIYSWYVTLRRWPAWVGQSEGLRAAVSRAASLDPVRAVGHGLMALLSIALSSFSQLALSIIPEGQETLADWIVFVFSLAIIALASAVAARVVRDLLRQRRARRPRRE